MFGYPKNKLISITIISFIVLPLLLCCGSAWSNIVFDSSNMEMGTEQPGCHPGGMGENADTSDDHINLFLSNTNNLLEYFVFSTFIVFGLISFYYLNNNFLNYIKNIRDKYGGFSFLNYLIHLFKIGILHPKTF